MGRDSSRRMSYYEEIEIEDMEYCEKEQMYYYPCPCGDKFEISLEELHDGEDVAPCPSCTLRIKIIFEEDDLPALPEFESEDEDEQNGAVVEVDVKATFAPPITTHGEMRVKVDAEAAGAEAAAAEVAKLGLTDDCQTVVFTTAMATATATATATTDATTIASL